MPESEERVCCCAIGNFTKEIVRLQIFGCIFRILFWLLILVGTARGIYMIEHGLKMRVEPEHEPTPDELTRERYVFIAVVSVAALMILIYGFGLFLGITFFNDASNKLENHGHLQAWHYYAALSLFFGLIFDLLLILASHGLSSVCIVFTIALNAYTMKGMKLQQERKRYADILDLSIHLTEEY